MNGPIVIVARYFVGGRWPPKSLNLIVSLNQFKNRKIIVTSKTVSERHLSVVFSQASTVHSCTVPFTY